MIGNFVLSQKERDHLTFVRQDVEGRFTTLEGALLL